MPAFIPVLEKPLRDAKRFRFGVSSGNCQASLRASLQQKGKFGMSAALKSHEVRFACEIYGYVGLCLHMQLSEI